MTSGSTQAFCTKARDIPYNINFALVLHLHAMTVLQAHMQLTMCKQAEQQPQDHSTCQTTQGGV